MSKLLNHLVYYFELYEKSGFFSGNVHYYTMLYFSYCVLPSDYSHMKKLYNYAFTG